MEDLQGYHIHLGWTRQGEIIEYYYMWEPSEGRLGRVYIISDQILTN